MVFSDPAFLFIFLPATLCLYWAVAWRFRNAYLIVVGSLFYLVGAGNQLLLLFGTVIINYFLARKIQRQGPNPRIAKAFLILGISANVLSLSLWKYTGFFAEIAENLMGIFGGDFHYSLNLILPIGISFFTFQCVSFLVDVYQRKQAEFPSFIEFAAYIFLFPHLIAGPIVRYADIEDEMRTVPQKLMTSFSYGAPRFFWGLSKKILIADQISVIADRTFALPDSRLTFLTAWLGVVAYSLQIYFDFSGYSDMAIGLARMFGFSFKENFERPYSARTVTDFWRRWHISLSSWFRDYVYVPLGGNRRGSRRTYLNLFLVFLLTGLWHGAQWTFVLWGLYHGAILIIERRFRGRKTFWNQFAFVNRSLVFIAICFGWVLFRASSVGHAINFMWSMSRPIDFSIPIVIQEVLTTQRITWGIIGFLVVLVPSNIHFGHIISSSETRFGQVLRILTVSILAPLSCLYALTNSFSPFLYFQF